MNSRLQALTSNCRLCSIFQKERVASDADMPWLVDDQYAALVSVGALVPGWTLLCPRGHAMNMQNAYADQAFWEFAATAEKHVRARYGRVAIFEHGPSSVESTTGCGTGHAHLHIVPIEFDLAKEAIQFDPLKTWTSCFASEIAKIANGEEYLFVSNNFEGARTRGMLCVLSESTSQFFRKVVAQRLGMSEFSDYRRHPMLEIAEQSHEALSADVTKEGLIVATQASL